MHRAQGIVQGGPNRTAGGRDIQTTQQLKVSQRPYPNARALFIKSPNKFKAFLRTEAKAKKIKIGKHPANEFTNSHGGL